MTSVEPTKEASTHADIEDCDYLVIGLDGHRQIMHTETSPDGKVIVSNAKTSRDAFVSVLQ